MEPDRTPGNSAQAARDGKAQAEREVMRSLSFAMAVINLAAEELLTEGYTLSEVIIALEAYTEAAKKANAQKGKMQ